MSINYERIAAQVELDELILAGAEQAYHDKAERFRAILAAAETLSHTPLKGTASYLRKHVQETYRKECREAGVCPDCGGDVTVEDRRERHPSPFGLGTVTEHRQVYVCEHCGEVD